MRCDVRPFFATIRKGYLCERASMALCMVRSSAGGRLADEFMEKGVVALGGAPVGDLREFPDKVQALVENYENADQETRTLVPLTRLFWPI